MKMLPKRFLALLLAMAMCITLLPAVALADGTHTHDGVTFEIWESTDSLPTSGSYCLNADVVLPEDSSTLRHVLTGDLNLCLNGHAVDLYGGIEIPTGITFNLYDCGTSVGHKFNDVGSGSTTMRDLELDEEDGAIVISGGVLYDADAVAVTSGSSTTNQYGYAVMLKGTAVFNMYGGTIAGSTYAAVDIGESGSSAAFNFYGGVLRDNQMGVYRRAACSMTFNMYGGEIFNNHIGVGTVSHMNMSGGKIYNNNTGISLYDQSATVFTMSGGELYGCAETRYDLNLCRSGSFSNGAYPAQVYITGDAAVMNFADGPDGNIKLYVKSTMQLTDGATQVVAVAADGYTFTRADVAKFSGGWYESNSGGTAFTLHDDYYFILKDNQIVMTAEEPEETEPEETEPEETEPEVTQPEETQPEETQPEETEPESTEPESTEPESTEPESTEPESTEPESTEPEIESVVLTVGTNEAITMVPGVEYSITMTGFEVASMMDTPNVILSWTGDAAITNNGTAIESPYSIEGYVPRQNTIVATVTEEISVVFTVEQVVVQLPTLVVGENSIEVDGEVIATFTAPADGTYYFYTAEGETNAYININEGEEIISESGVASIVVTEGQTVNVSIATYDYSVDTIDFIISDVNPEPEEVETVTVYRLYNQYTHEHLLVTDETERTNLLEAGWSEDGIAWNAPTTGNPVYRLYNPFDDWHMYTNSEEEMELLLGQGWTLDGPVSCDAGEGGIPIYRLFNPYEQSNYLLFTAGVDEIEYLVSLGWENHGIGWFAAE